MGKVWTKLYNKKEVRILMWGLDAAGKTTILYKLKLGEIVTTIPTIGFNVETLEVNNTRLTTWDVGNRSGTRGLMRHYYPNTQGLIFVVDSADKERLPEVRDELKIMLTEEELQKIPILFMLNKQDLTNAMSVEEISEILELHKIGDRPWFVSPSIAIKGIGLDEGLEWLADTLAGRVMTESVGQYINLKTEEEPQKENIEDTKKSLYGWDYITCGISRSKSWLMGSK